NEEREERLTDGVPEGAGTATAAVEAAKGGFEYRKDAKGGWSVVRKKTQPVLRIGRVASDDPDFATFCLSFKLNPQKRTFELTTETLAPFLVGAPEQGLEGLDLETRSLRQVLFFVANGVEVPPEHLISGIAPMTPGADGAAFDWDLVLGGLFKVCWASG